MKKFAENPLLSREDLQQLAGDLFRPLLPSFSSGGGRVGVGVNTSNYSDATAEFEGFARPLWGLAPLLAGGGGETSWQKLYCAGLTHGSDPQHPDYWGRLTQCNQTAVEMAPLAFALLINPDQFWDPLLPETRTRLVTWLQQINRIKLWDNNWLFFRVLVNLALQKLGADHDAELRQKDLDRLDDFYLGEGWYYDGANRSRDYYVAFAFHYYGLLYAKFNQEEDPERSQVYQDRAALFAQDFVHWFSANGEALPYGRSLTYRFAQSAFWGALAWAEVPVFSWGCLKGLLLRNLRWWMQQDIFTETGRLSIGYGYDHAAFGERYNSPASPYWAFKSFLPLALPDTHPFWQSPEEGFPVIADVKAMPHAAMILMREGASGNVTALCGGQNAADQFRHVAEKFSKFAYATHFGFNVSSSSQGICHKGIDSMLSFSTDGRHFLVRDHSRPRIIDSHTICSKWKVGDLAEIETFLVACPPWHVRVHLIRNKKRVQTWEGGFPVPKESSGSQLIREGLARLDGESGTSLIMNLAGERKGIICAQDYGLNSHHPQVEVPVLGARLFAGRHILACAVKASSSRIPLEASEAPRLEILSDSVLISVMGETYSLPLPRRYFTLPSAEPSPFRKLMSGIKRKISLRAPRQFTSEHGDL